MVDPPTFGAAIAAAYLLKSHPWYWRVLAGTALGVVLAVVLWEITLKQRMVYGDPATLNVWQIVIYGFATFIWSLIVAAVMRLRRKKPPA